MTEKDLVSFAYVQKVGADLFEEMLNRKIDSLQKDDYDIFDIKYSTNSTLDSGDDLLYTAFILYK